MYYLAEEITDRFLTFVDELDLQIDDVENNIFINPDPLILENIFDIKRILLNIRRLLSSQREVFNKLARGDFEMINQRDKIYFRDIYDNIVRLYDITEISRELVSGALETYLSIVNNRMNEIMKTLTIFTALFMPLSFLTSFFGMNFFEPAFALPIWTGKFAFYVVLSITFFTPVIMYAWIRNKKWL